MFKSFNGIDPIPWRPGNGGTANFTDEERQAWAAAIEHKATERKQAQEAARIKAFKLYQRSKAATADHPYLVKKKITNVGELKVRGNDLIVPLYNARTDEFQTYQRITPDGDKLFPTDSETAGAYGLPGLLPRMADLWAGDGLIVICEGYATAYAIQSAVSPRYRVIWALNCGNLIEVAKILHDRFPLRDFIIAADNDIEVLNKRGFNPGIRDATRAALAIGRKITVPPPKDTDTSGDFWDLWHAEGDAAVKRLIDEAVEPQAEETAPPVDQPLNGAADATILKRPPLNGKGPKGFSLTCTKDIIMKPKDWLWEGHLARGVQELLSGIPGLGKSQVQISYIASVTAGRPWPDGTKAKSPASVIMMTAEDRPPAKTTSKIDIDPRVIAADFFRRLGGMEGMTKWGKTHRSLAYQLIAKLMAQPLVQTNVNVNNVRVDGEAARRQLETAFMRVIEARKHDGDPAVYVDGERLRDDGRIIEHQPSTADPRPASPDHRRGTDDSSPSADDSRLGTADHGDAPLDESLKSPNSGSPISRGGDESTAAGGKKNQSVYSKPILSIPGLAAGVALDATAGSHTPAILENNRMRSLPNSPLSLRPSSGHRWRFSWWV